MNDPHLSAAELKRLEHLWEEAVETVEPPLAQNMAQALLFGVNLRIDLAKAFVAALATGKAAVSVTAAANVPFAWPIWLNAICESVGAACAIFASLVQRMRPIDYVTCVVLSNSSNGMTDTELREAVEKFLNDPQAAQLSWYVGMSNGRLQQAKEVLAMRDWFEQTVQSLKDAGFLESPEEKLKFKPQHLTIGWKL